MLLKKILSEGQVLKFKNIKIIYLTPKNQLWAIFSTGAKKCITKNFEAIIELFKFLKTKILISYKDSLRIKKGVNFNIFINRIDIILKKKIINIEFLNKQNIFNLIEEFKCKKKAPLITNYYIKDIFAGWCIPQFSKSKMVLYLNLNRFICYNFYVASLLQFLKLKRCNWKFIFII